MLFNLSPLELMAMSSLSLNRKELFNDIRKQGEREDDSFVNQRFQCGLDFEKRRTGNRRKTRLSIDKEGKKELFEWESKE